MIRILSIGIENYQDTSQHRVAFAENDANEISKAWTALYGDECDVVTILSGEATRGRVIKELKSLASRTDSADTIVLYFAGHGFSTGTHNLLSVNDTFLSTLEETAIRFETVYAILNDAGAQKLMMFIDACHSGFDLNDSRGAIEMFSADELRLFDKDSSFAVSFSSCNQGEESFAYPAENHGCWTYHLLRALRGDEPDLLYDGQILKAIRLQEYLATEVPALVRNIRMGAAKQSPRLFGTLNQDFIVADMANLLAAKEPAAIDLAPYSEKIALIGTEKDRIQNLSGFRRGHRVPELINTSTKSFVTDIGSKEIQELQSKLYKALHEGLGIKFSDMKVSESRDGFRIICPAFDVQSNLEQSSDDPGQYSIQIWVDNFRDTTILRTEEFVSVFDSYLDEIEISLDRTQNLDQIVKRLESSKHVDDFDYIRNQVITLDLIDPPILVKFTQETITLAPKNGGLSSLLELAPAGLTAISESNVTKSLPTK